jgi:hypothetical protein
VIGATHLRFSDLDSNLAISGFDAAWGRDRLS